MIMIQNVFKDLHIPLPSDISPITCILTFPQRPAIAQLHPTNHSLPAYSRNVALLPVAVNIFPQFVLAMKRTNPQQKCLSF